MVSSACVGSRLVAIHVSLGKHVWRSHSRLAVRSCLRASHQFSLRVQRIAVGSCPPGSFKLLPQGQGRFENSERLLENFLVQ